MSDLIDRKEAVEAVKNEMLSWLEGDSHDYRKVVDAIMDVPTVEAVPVVHGRWIENDNGTYSCSRCNSWIPKEQRYYAKFCLYCGADMRGEQDG